MASIIRGDDGFDSEGSKGLGNGQTWQNVMASRADSVTYTNTTGRPILVSIGCPIAGYAIHWYAYVGGVEVMHSYTYASSSSTNAIFVVPDGGTYSTAGLNAIWTWAELR